MTTYSYLIFLLESAFYSILEKNKLKSLNLEISSEDEKHINKTMKAIKERIYKIEQEQSDFENNVNISTETLKQQEYILIRIQDYYRRLEEMLESENTDDYELIIDLKKEEKEHKLENEFLRTSNSKETEDFNNTFIKSSQESQKQILKAQQQIIKEQDLSLNNLYDSISTQKELTIQMESELELHNEFLEEMEVLVDKSQGKLKKSEKRLKKVVKNIKKKGKYFQVK
ncbi:uncharacterized protein T551_03126 [Pneumocystis jirovecii RU7]|uniref:t-SNARE coiled-coil homology domain-containing protein n=1 Tax=Pneumocystis jirovecii (strain RU7) TaxID=1408657 RepID=A0A0W4ZFH2_PNEJ7|nr:uncharacterized protein T551_03126 [Pneumocystis jirovecii RU7]KTW27132.1 hypothetical protein T551_03126 [Pneumocystis jirovecii RU7]